MNITQTLNSQLLVDFKSQIRLNKAFQNYELYKFFNLNSIQLLKLYSIESSKIFNETNARKHLVKIYDMIKNNFYNQKTQNYINLFFIPTNSIKEINSKRDAILNISNFNLDLEFQKQIKSHILKLDEFDYKISFSKQIYTLEKSTQDYLYENYSLHIISLSRKDLEEMQNESNSSFIIISEENLFIEADQYTLKDFNKLIQGYLIKKNKTQILNLIEFFLAIKLNNIDLINSTQKLTNKNYLINLDLEQLKQTLQKDNIQELKQLSKKATYLELEVEKINHGLKEKISTKKLSLEGDELLELLNSGNMQALADKLKHETKDYITIKEKELLEEFKKYKLSINYIFETHTYPLKINLEVKEELLKQIEDKISAFEYSNYLELGSFNFSQIEDLNNLAYFYDLFNGILKFSKKYNLEFANISNEFKLLNAKNIYIENPVPILYGLGIDELNNTKLKQEKICVLTGANSGGKTTLLEMFLQSQILTTLGLGIAASNQSNIKLLDEVIYLKKFSGTQGAGAFEQTIRNLVEILDSPTTKLILIDEFEAITEPGAAAKILIGFLQQLSKQDNFCIAVSHLGAEIKDFIDKSNITSIRLDGISATGLDEKGNLMTNHQPQFYQLGKSTPELILKRVLQDDNFWKNKSQSTRNLLENILR